MNTCQRCKKNLASVTVTEIMSFVRPGAPENRLRVVRVCDQCAQGLNLPHASAAPVAMADNFWKILFSAKQVRTQSRAPRCKSCGMTLEELRRHGRLGCPEDYVVFKDYLGELLERMHGARQHVGRVPGIGEGELERIQRVSDLKTELEAAVAKEDYEQAAAIRDELRVLEQEEAEDPSPH